MPFENESSSEYEEFLIQNGEIWELLERGQFTEAITRLRYFQHDGSELEVGWAVDFLEQIPVMYPDSGNLDMYPFAIWSEHENQECSRIHPQDTHEAWQESLSPSEEHYYDLMSRPVRYVNSEPTTRLGNVCVFIGMVTLFFGGSIIFLVKLFI